ncbi:unnamed protein product [Eruca vesicaria subsp. sativa]|uniref:Uncharacterized protein n=1 Tax=Eruca vesicaria subsp. sativa TaxID=29727 RepID=A0ABC8IUI3_ERUVS|nr:unnamed protein product [Eruca vesicaria subsp. sativa]
MNVSNSLKGHESWQATTRELYDKVCAKKGVSQEKAHIWDYINMRKGQVLEVSCMSIEELGLHMTQDILLEVDGSSEVNDELPLEEKPSGLAGLVGKHLLHEQRSSVFGTHTSHT